MMLFGQAEASAPRPGGEGWGVTQGGWGAVVATAVAADGGGGGGWVHQLGRRHRDAAQRTRRAAEERLAEEQRHVRAVSGRFHIWCGRFDWDLPLCCVFFS
jgi:hypothetical protein